MNYKRIYDELIVKAKTRETVDGYKERHHIIPRSVGGLDDAKNLVNLTAREHFIAHNCLARIHGGVQWAAILIMKGNGKYNNSRLFETARIAYAKSQKGKIASNITKQKLSDAKIGKPPNSAGKPLSEHHKEKLRSLYIGKPRTEADKKSISLGSVGKVMPPISDNHRLKLKEAKAGKKPNNFGKPRSKVAIEKASFTRKARHLNNLINSIFTPLAA